MARVCPLFSSSSGNCTYVGNGDTSLLVDAGGSCKAILRGLEEIGAPAESIRGVVVTHEHHDHIAALWTLVKRLKVPVYASLGTLEFLAAMEKAPAGAELIELTTHTAAQIGSLAVQGFATPHDSAESFGISVTFPDGARASIATDLGHVPESVLQALSGSDLVMLESNYETGMLDCSSYPYYLKRRIKSETGHLTNTACAETAVKLAQSGTTRFILSHLSRENNTEQIAYQTTLSRLLEAGLTQGRDFLLEVAQRSCASRMMTF